jgi:glycosyltransferase involved in cell wall biosynthesis
MSSPVNISIVTPAYKCAECITEMHRRLTQVLSAITPDYEIIFVDDRSPQNDWEIISGICAKDPHVRGVQLSRNYGQHFAITAGLDHARGEWIVVMDCDLQDRPEEIAKLYAKAMEGHDVVFARRCERNDSLYRKLVSNGFRLIYNWLGDIDFDNSIANFSICSRRVIESVCSFRERNRSFPVFILELGFRRTTVDVEHAARFAGKSSYNLVKLLDFAVQCVVARSNKPLRLSIRFGFFLAILSVLYGTVVIVRYFTLDVAVEGWTTLAVLISFLGGLGFANLGIVGLYLGKVFDEVKLRPLYFVQTSLNDPSDAAPAMISATTPARIHA